MLRKLFALSLITLFVLSIAGCSNSLKDVTDNTPASKPEGLESTNMQSKKNGENKMKNYAKEILESIRNGDGDFVQILEIIQEKCSYGENLEKLTNGEKTIFLISEVEGEVNNGGFDQYFYNSSGANAKEAITAFGDIGAKFTASLLANAKDIYKNGITNDGRNEPEVDLTEDQTKKLNELDNKFYEYNDKLGDLQIKYITNHIGEF